MRIAVFVLFCTVLLSSCDFTGGVVVDPNDACSALEGPVKDNCYLEEMKCSKIVTESLRDACVIELAKAKKDLKVCDLVQDAQTKDFCIEQLAEVTNDHLLCYDIDSEYWGNNCHYNLALQQSEKQFCSLITKVEQSQECFYAVALDTNDSELCTLLSGNDIGRCFQKIAIATANPKLCLIFASKLNKDTCRLQVAKKNNRQDLCKNIVISQVRDVCNEAFQ